MSDRASQRSESQGGRLPRVVLFLGLVICLGYWAVEVYLLSGYIGFPLDDSWIHLQFARHLATGEGLAFNQGQLVPGSTAPLWTGLLSVLFLIPGNTLIWVKVLGILLFLCGAWAVWRFAAELGMSFAAALTATLLSLATSWLVWSALSGLEIPLFVVLSIVGMTLHMRERRDSHRPPLSLVVLACSFLARPEGLLLLLLALVDRCLVFERQESRGWRWRPPRRDVWITAALAGLILIVPTLVFNWWIAGSGLPTTFAAKAAGLERWIPELKYLYTVLGIFFQVQPAATLLAGAGILVLCGRLGGPRDRGLLPALWCIGLPLAYGLINPPGAHALVGNFGRYFFPLLPVVVVLAVFGIDSLLMAQRDAPRPGRVQTPIALVFLLPLLVLPPVAELIQGAGRYGQNVLNVQESDVAVARWLADRLPAEALLGVADIGAIKYLLPNRIVDLAGIASPEIKQIGTEAFLEQHRPDYLVIFEQWYERLLGGSDGYSVVRRFPIQDNITMGGDTLVIYATPWTRHKLAEPAMTDP